MAVVTPTMEIEMASGKCPKCERLTPALNIEPVDIREAGRSAWKGVTLSCPFCHAIMGASIDPIAIKTDIVNAVIGALKG
jgi:hypothetical protein